MNGKDQITQPLARSTASHNRTQIANKTALEHITAHVAKELVWYVHKYKYYMIFNFNEWWVIVRL